MAEPSNLRIVPLVDQRARSIPVSSLAADPRTSSAEQASPTDRLGRPLRDLRISVTDRCNFRCSYCMPKDVFEKDYQ